MAQMDSTHQKNPPRCTYIGKQKIFKETPHALIFEDEYSVPA